MSLFQFKINGEESVTHAEAYGVDEMDAVIEAVRNWTERHEWEIYGYGGMDVVAVGISTERTYNVDVTIDNVEGYDLIGLRLLDGESK